MDFFLGLAAQAVQAVVPVVADGVVRVAEAVAETPARRERRNSSRSRSPRRREQPSIVATGRRSLEIKTGITKVMDAHNRLKEEENYEEGMGEVLVGTVNKLGGGCQKIAQQMQDTFPGAIRQRLLSLLEDCPARSAQAVSAQIESAFRGEYELIRVLKAGTIGEASLVRELASGLELVVKTFQPEAARRFEEDIAVIMTFLPELVPSLLRLKGIGEPLKGKVTGVLDRIVAMLRNDAFQQGVMAEMDALAEARNIERAREFEGPMVFVPKVRKVAESVLVMDYVKGSSAAEFASVPWPSKEVQWRLLRELVAFFFKTWHADMHPGNVIVCGEKVGVIDWGSVLQLGEGKAAMVVGLMRRIHAGDYGGCVELWRELGVRVASGEAGRQLALLSEDCDLLAALRGAADSVENAARTGGLEMGYEASMLYKATHALASTLKTLGAKCPEWARDLKRAQGVVLEVLGR